MDPLAEIRAKIAAMPDAPTKTGLQAVLRHLELAQAHHDRARTERDDDYFNDAVYRANQAYEGALKEAWRILRAEDPSKKKTHQLESGLAESGVLTDRARGLLENYRQQWRNPSTHDHTILFGQQDAFLAIWSAIAFASVLLDQIVTKLSEEEAASELGEAPLTRPDVPKPLDEYLPAYLEAFARTSHAFHRADGTPRSEAETLGWLIAYLKNQGAEIEVQSNPSLESGIRPDLLLTQGDRRVVVEFKRGVGTSSAIHSASAQLLRYMDELGVDEGALILAPASQGTEMDSWVDVYSNAKGGLVRIIVVAPKDSLRT